MASPDLGVTSTDRRSSSGCIYCCSRGFMRERDVVYSSMIFRRSVSEYRSLGLKWVRIYINDVNQGGGDALLLNRLKKLNALRVWLPEFFHYDFFYLFSVNPFSLCFLLLPLLLVSHSLVRDVSLNLRMRSVDTDNIQIPFKVFETEKAVLLNRFQKCCQIFETRVFYVHGCGYRL